MQDISPTAEYPRVYTSSRGTKILLVISGLLIGGFSLIAPITLFSKQPILAVVIALLPMLLVFYFFAAAFKAKTVLYADRIESYGVFGMRSLSRDNIAGVRYISTRGGNILLLVPKDPQQKKISIALSLKRDQTFNDWMNFPNLNLEDVKKSAEEIAADPRLGATPEERTATIKKAQTIAKILHVASFCLLIWLFFPVPYKPALITAAIVPWCALGLVAFRPGWFVLDAKVRDLRPNILFLLLMPAGGLFLRAIIDIQTIDWIPVAMITVAAAGFFMVIVTMIGSQRTNISTPSSFLCFFLFAVVYSFGLVTFVNVLSDNSRPQFYQTAVIAKHISSSGRGGTHRDFTIAPWGPRTENNTVMVGRNLYDSTAVGDKICVQLKPGALGARWYVVFKCPVRTAS